MSSTFANMQQQLAEMRLQDKWAFPFAKVADETFPLFEELPLELQIMVWNEAMRSPGIHFIRLALDHVLPNGRFIGLSLPVDAAFYTDAPQTHKISSSIYRHQLRHTGSDTAGRVVDLLIKDAADPKSKDHLAGWRVEQNATLVGWHAKGRARAKLLTEQPSPHDGDGYEGDTWSADCATPVPQVPLLLMNVKTDLLCVVCAYDYRPCFEIQTDRRAYYFESLMCYLFPQMHDVRQLAVYDHLSFSYDSRGVYGVRPDWAPIHFPFLEVVYLVNFNIKPNHTQGLWKVPQGAKTFDGKGHLFIEVRPEDAALWTEKATMAALARAETYNKNKMTPRKAMKLVMRPDPIPPDYFPDFWLNSQAVRLADGRLSPDPCKVKFKVLACVKNVPN